MRIRLLWVVLVVALGCRDKKARPDPAAAAPQAAGDSTAGDAAVPVRVPEMVRISLRDAGKEPRASLRYRLSVGDKQTIILRLAFRANNRPRAAAPKTVIMPGIKLVFHIEIVDAELGDRARYRFDLVESALTDVADADPTIVKMAKASLAKAQGLRGSAVVDSRGVIRDGTIEVPTELAPGMKIVIDSIRNSMEQLTTPLPQEDVGVGARWEVRQTLVQGGIAVDQTTTFELVASRNGVLEVNGRLEQDASRQDVALEGAEFAELISLQATGESNSRVSLTRLAPLEFESSVQSESNFEFAKKHGRRRALVSIGTSKTGIRSQ